MRETDAVPIAAICARSTDLIESNQLWRVVVCERRDMSQTCVASCGRCGSTHALIRIRSHSPQPAECDHGLSRGVRSRVRRREATQNSVEWGCHK